MDASRKRRTLERAESLAGESEAKKGRKAALLCSSCRKKPSTQTDWDELESKHGRTNPIGDKCRLCADTWRLAFNYLSWSKFAALQQTEDPDTMKREHNNTQPEKRSLVGDLFLLVQLEVSHVRDWVWQLKGGQCQALWLVAGDYRSQSRLVPRRERSCMRRCAGTWKSRRQSLTTLLVCLQVCCEGHC